MILSCSYNVPAEERMFDRFRTILKEDYGLVLALGYPPEIKHPTNHFEVLVYEEVKDHYGTGRFRVHCSVSTSQTTHEFDFSYWRQRLTPIVVRTDPMKSILERFFQEAKSPVELPHLRDEASIEKLLKEVL